MKQFCSMQQQLEVPTGGPLIRVKRPATVKLNDESQPKEETKKGKKTSTVKTKQYRQVNSETTWNNNNNNDDNDNHNNNNNNHNKQQQTKQNTGVIINHPLVNMM